MKILSLSGENLASLTGQFTIDFAGGAWGCRPVCHHRQYLARARAPCSMPSVWRSTTRCRALSPIARMSPKWAAWMTRRSSRPTTCAASSAAATPAVLPRCSFAAVTAASGWPAGGAPGPQPRRGRFQAQERSLTDVASGQVFSGSKRELQDRIDELVGLSWEQFRRAVILPQGVCRLPKIERRRAFGPARTDDRHRALLRHFGPDP